MKDNTPFKVLYADEEEDDCHLFKKELKNSYCHPPQNL